MAIVVNQKGEATDESQRRLFAAAEKVSVGSYSVALCQPVALCIEVVSCGFFAAGPSRVEDVRMGLWAKIKPCNQKETNALYHCPF